MGERVGPRISDVGCANSLCVSAESGRNPHIHSRARVSRITEARASHVDEAQASRAERRTSYAEASPTRSVIPGIPSNCCPECTRNGSSESVALSRIRDGYHDNIR
eukprot:3794653-Pleurochrysis_carterae.AAC.1